MGAIVNGLVLSGLRAYGATFLIFSDYMKGAVRLAALMELPSIFVLHARLDRRSARTARRTSRSSSSRRCARRRTSTSCAPPTRTRPRSRGASRCARPRRRRCSRSRASRCRCSTRRWSPTTRSSAAPTCCATRDGDAGAGPDRHRLGGLAVRGRGRASWPRDGHRGARRQHAVHGPLRAPERRPSASACSARPGRARVAVEAASPLGWDRWVGERGAVIGDDDVRRLRARGGRLRALRHHRGSRRRAGPRTAAST